MVLKDPLKLSVLRKDLLAAKSGEPPIMRQATFVEQSEAVAEKIMPRRSATQKKKGGRYNLQENSESEDDESSGESGTGRSGESQTEESGSRAKARHEADEEAMENFRLRVHNNLI